MIASERCMDFKGDDMDFFTDIFDSIMHWVFVYLVELPMVLTVIGAAIWALVKWPGFDSYEKKRSLVCLSLLVAVVAGMHWLFDVPRSLAFLMHLAPILAIIAIAGWLFFQFAITGIGSQIDEGMDNLREIARNSRKDKF